MSTLYTDSLPRENKEVYSKLSNFSDEFVLGGGTAIMLQINHRKSFDFDCFSSKPLEKTLPRKAKQVFGNTIDIQVNNSNLLLFKTEEGIKIDFVYYPYPPLYKLKRAEPIPLFDISDLASNKAHTIGRRATWRDYVDIFFLLKWEHTNLRKVIREAKKRFGGEFSEKLFLEQLVFYEDLEFTPIEFLKEEYSVQEIQSFLKENVEDFTRLKIS